MNTGTKMKTKTGGAPPIRFPILMPVTEIGGGGNGGEDVGRGDEDTKMKRED